MLMGLVLFMKLSETTIRHDQKLNGSSLEFSIMLFLPGLKVIPILKDRRFHSCNIGKTFKQQVCKNKDTNTEGYDVTTFEFPSQKKEGKGG